MPDNTVLVVGLPKARATPPTTIASIRVAIVRDDAKMSEAMAAHKNNRHSEPLLPTLSTNEPAKGDETQAAE
jgi:hypothetical protein